MLAKTVLLTLLLTVAATEGRARGSKLGYRSSRQSVWGRPRQDAPPQPAYPLTPDTTGNPGTYPPPVTVTPPQGGGYPSQTQTIPPSSGSYTDQGNQIPIVVSGIPPLDQSVCRYPGFFPTPGSCVNFYRCVDFSGTGTSYSVFQFNCPAGTIFDDDLDICNHIAWTVPKRPECSDMLQGSLVPVGSGPAAPGSGQGGYTQPGQGGYTQPGGSGAYPTKPLIPPQTVQPASIYPQPGPEGSANALPKPFSLECYADGTYRRHPLYCNQYYTCTFDGSSWVFPTLVCPVGLIFNEAAQQCADPASIAPCDGQLAPYAPAEAITTELPTEAPSTDTPTGQQGPAVDPSSLYDCPSTGYYSFESDCIRFYKCVQLESGALKGLLYKCPEGFGYSDEKKRCDKLENLAPCDKVLTPVADVRLASPTELYPEDLLWFFNN